MGFLLDFFAAGPARIKGLVWGALALLAVAGGLTGWALFERASRFQAQAELERVLGERDRALDQVAVLNSGIEACNAGVETAKRAAADAVTASQRLLAEARRLAAGSRGQVKKIEALLRQNPPARADGTPAGCDEAWAELERLVGPARSGGPAKQKARGP